MAIATQGPNAPSTMGTDSSVGAIDWTSPDNAKASDNVYARCQLIVAIQPDSFMLVATNFGFSVPTNATIKGVQATLERKASNEAGNRDCFDEFVQLYVGNVASGNNKASLLVWPTAEGSITYGSDTDTWGITDLTPTVVNSTAFGFGINANINATAVGTVNASADAMSLAVWYDIPPVGGMLPMMGVG